MAELLFPEDARRLSPENLSGMINQLMRQHQLTVHRLRHYRRRVEPVTVHGEGCFECKRCADRGWTSTYAWISVDLIRQMIVKKWRMRCLICRRKTEPFFTLEETREMVIEAIRLFKGEYVARRIRPNRPKKDQPPTPHLARLCEKCSWGRDKCWQQPRFPTSPLLIPPTPCPAPAPRRAAPVAEMAALPPQVVAPPEVARAVAEEGPEDTPTAEDTPGAGYASAVKGKDDGMSSDDDESDDDDDSEDKGATQSGDVSAAPDESMMATGGRSEETADEPVKCSYLGTDDTQTEEEAGCDRSLSGLFKYIFTFAEKTYHRSVG